MIITLAYGTTVRSSIQIRKSKNLIQWQFVGWVFNSLPAQGSDYITQSGGTPFQSLWAPYMMKVGNEFRLYYLLSSSTYSAEQTTPDLQSSTTLTLSSDGTINSNSSNQWNYTTPWLELT